MFFLVRKKTNLTDGFRQLWNYKKVIFLRFFLYNSNSSRMIGRGLSVNFVSKYVSRGSTQSFYTEQIKSGATNYLQQGVTHSHRSCVVLHVLHSSCQHPRLQPSLCLRGTRWTYTVTVSCSMASFDGTIVSTYYKDRSCLV